LTLILDDQKVSLSVGFGTIFWWTADRALDIIITILELIMVDIGTFCTADPITAIVVSDQLQFIGSVVELIRSIGFTGRLTIGGSFVEHI
jgi:hypothetical protein